MAMALRSLSLSLARTMTTTLRRRPPPRSLHHHQDNKLMMSSWSTSRNTSRSGGNYCKGCQDRDRLIDELEEGRRRRFARMTMDNKLSGMTSPKTEAPTGWRWGNYFEYDTPQNFDESVKRYEERRSVNRMVITGAVSAYCIALFILSSMRNKVKEDLRNLCNN